MTEHQQDASWNVAEWHGKMLVDRGAPLASDDQAGACGVRAGCLGALTKRPGDGVGSRLYAELGF